MSSLTPETLLQLIDSFIDIYSDEESSFDVPVFRAGHFLRKMNDCVAGVRALVSPFRAARWMSTDRNDLVGEESRQEKVSRIAYESRWCAGEHDCVHRVS